MSEGMNEWLKEWMDEWVNEWMNEWKNEWVNEWKNDWMSEGMNEWVKEWMNGWMSQWMSEWMNEWTVTCGCCLWLLGFPFRKLHNSITQSAFSHHFQVKRGGCMYLLVSCFSRASWAPSWYWDRWWSWEWVLKGTVTEWTGSTVTTGSSEFVVKTGQKSDSSSSTSSSFSAPSHSDAGPKWVCSSVGQRRDS